MRKPKRVTIFIPSDGSLYEYYDDPTGQWIYDPDKVLNLEDQRFLPCPECQELFGHKIHCNEGMKRRNNSKI
jgi:hypothetical protein